MEDAEHPRLVAGFCNVTNNWTCRAGTNAKRTDYFADRPRFPLPSCSAGKAKA
jgi:hypothetical protein